MQGFTLTMDYLAFTVPSTTLEEVTALLGGDWTKVEAGYLGYPLCWVTEGESRGTGKIGMGAPRKLHEAHVDLTSGVVASWPSEKMQAVLIWIKEKGGHLTRIDCALDDRAMSVPLDWIKVAIKTGQIVTRASQAQILLGEDLDLWATTGETVSIGSRRSQTFLRIYDKRLELTAKGQPDANEYGIRWELELKKDRADALGQLLRCHPIEEWRELVVGVLQSYVDFRDTDKAAEPWTRYRAARLPWWESLTEGFKKCRLVVEQARRTIEHVKEWVNRSLAPMLALVVAAPGAGRSWLDQVITAGPVRWKERHYRLLKVPKPNREYVLRPSLGGQP